MPFKWADFPLAAARPVPLTDQDIHAARSLTKREVDEVELIKLLVSENEQGYQPPDMSLFSALELAGLLTVARCRAMRREALRYNPKRRRRR